MNERIRQCWLTAAREDSDDKWDTQEQFIERFAELIIQECAEVCKKQSFHYAEHNNQGSAASAADACRILIIQHFGVEE